MRTELRICPICEATCGLALTIDGDHVTAARGDAEDVFSAGFICPKGATFADLDNDPGRLTGPMVRRAGELTEATWDEAFDAVAESLGAVLAEHGGRSVGVYVGNPNAHTVAGALYGPMVIKALGTRNVFSASTLDQMPKQVALGHLFGSPFAFAVPDLDRTDHLVIIGETPGVQRQPHDGPGLPGQAQGAAQAWGPADRDRPARTRTAALADWHLAPRPGTDAALLFSVVHVLFDEDLVAPDLGASPSMSRGRTGPRDGAGLQSRPGGHTLWRRTRGHPATGT